jgi:hypothetical protein
LQALGAVQLGESVWPAGVLVHVPTLPVRLQAWQLPAQALLQHTPSTHTPLWHSLATLHEAPLDFLETQAVIRQ